ncbi:hypothetical protein [Streptomyces sp. NPDC055749]
MSEPEADPAAPAAASALDLPETAEALRRYRRRAGRWADTGTALLAATACTTPSCGTPPPTTSSAPSGSAVSRSS